MKWLSIHIGGQKWTVYLVSPKSKWLIDQAGERTSGRTWTDRCAIYISNAICPEARDETLLHEFQHAWNYVSGAWHEIVTLAAAEATTDENVAYEVEERSIRSATPVIHRLLKDLGFRFPTPPK